MVHPPKIQTCRLGLEGTGGVAFNSTFEGNTTSCDNTRDTFVNVQPVESFFDFAFEFKLPEDPPGADVRHKYIHDYHFGIVDGDVEMILYPKSGGKYHTGVLLSELINRLCQS